ncbi:MAG: hypothetical protein ABI650_09845 [Dokdonella sp.]
MGRLTATTGNGFPASPVEYGDNNDAASITAGTTSASLQSDSID